MNWDALHALLPRLRELDTDAWGDLSALVYPILVGAAARETGAGWADASTSDLVQDAWVVVRKGFGTFRGAGTPADTAACFRSWVRTVVRNLANRARQNHAGRVAGTGGPALLPEPVARDPTPSNQAARAEWRSRVEAALARLGPDEQLIVRRSLYEGASCRQIAAELGLADHTAVGAWRREILATLRQTLGEPND